MDPSDSLLDSLQITQNEFARFIHGSTLMDKINTKTIFKETNLLSINQLITEGSLKVEIKNTCLGDFLSNRKSV